MARKPKVAVDMHDILPIALGENELRLVREWMPNLSLNGSYQFTPKARDQKAAIQLEICMQNGSHKWLTNRIRDLINELENKASVGCVISRTAPLNQSHAAQNSLGINDSRPETLGA